MNFNKLLSKRSQKKILAALPVISALGVAVVQALAATDKPLSFRLFSWFFIAGVSTAAVKNLLDIWKRPGLIWSIYGLVFAGLLVVILTQYFTRPKPGTFSFSIGDDRNQGLVVTNIFPTPRIGPESNHVSISNCIIIPVEHGATNFHLHMAVAAMGAHAHTVQGMIMISTNADISVDGQSIPGSAGVEGSPWRKRFGGRGVESEGKPMNWWQSKIPEVLAGYASDYPPVSIDLKGFPDNNPVMLFVDLEAQNFPRQTAIAGLFFVPVPDHAKPKSMFYARLDDPFSGDLDKIAEFANATDRLEFLRSVEVYQMQKNDAHILFKASAPHATNSLWLTNKSLVSIPSDLAKVHYLRPFLLLPNSNNYAAFNLEFFVDRPMLTKNIFIEVITHPGIDRIELTDWTVRENSHDAARLEYKIVHPKQGSNPLPAIPFSPTDMKDRFRNLGLYVSGEGLTPFGLEFTLFLPQNDNWQEMKLANFSDFHFTPSSDTATNSNAH